MKGAIRTKERCRNCGRKFPATFECPFDKVHPESFYIDLSWNGQRIKVYSDRQGETLDSYRRAFSMLTVINEEIKDGTFDPSRYVRQDRSKFYASKLLDRFLSAKLKGVAPSYRAHYRRMVAVAEAHFGKKDVRDLRKIDLINYKEWIEATQALSLKTVKNYLAHFKTFLGWCREDLEIINVVPKFPEVKVPIREPKWLIREDQIKLLAFVPEGHRPIIQFLMFHGCRPSEARALKAKDVDVAGRTITISATFSAREYREQRKGQGAKPVIIPIAPECLAYFTERMKDCLPGAWAFTNPKNGRHYTENALRRIWDNVRGHANISPDLRLYDATRHSLASQLRKAGVDLPDIKDQLGHSDIRTTMKYSHGDIEKLRTNLEKLSVNKVVELDRPQSAPKRILAQKRK